MHTKPWVETWNAMISGRRSDVKIPGLWRISALAEGAPADAKEHMVTRLDENGENDENLKAKLVSYTMNRAQLTRGTSRNCRLRLATWAEVH